MNFFSGIYNGIKEIWAHKFRSLLSMIGIILGVAALVAMVGVVRGMVERFKVHFEETGGALKLQVEDEEPPNDQRHIAFLSPGRTLDDWYMIKQSVPLARMSAPEISLRWNPARTKYKHNWLNVTGTSPEIQEIERYKLSEGRFLSDLDVHDREKVIVISYMFKEWLFPDNVSAINQRVSIRGKPFTVIGVMEENPALRRKQYQAFIPVTTAAAYFRENENIHDLHVLAYNTDEIPDLIAQIENVLRVSHNGIDDFRVATREEELQEFKQMERGFMYSLGGVAAISLLVGGIGIMNVMLAVINERIREIGVRKAVGARGSDIFVQFLAESIVISVIGGLIGVMASVGLVSILRSTIESDRIQVILAPDAMVYGFIFSVAIGVLSGIYPAARAARLNVIEALRYE